MCDTYISAYDIACLKSTVIKFNLNRDYDLKIPSGPPVTHSRFAVWSGSALRSGWCIFNEPFKGHKLWLDSHHVGIKSQSAYCHSNIYLHTIFAILMNKVLLACSCICLSEHWLFFSQWYCSITISHQHRTRLFNVTDEARWCVLFFLCFQGWVELWCALKGIVHPKRKICRGWLAL